MVQKPDPKETVDFKELQVSNMIEIQALVQLLIEKGLITESEWDEKLSDIYKECRELSSC
jgi:hypothetical protein